MSEYLKGNYKLSGSNPLPAPQTPQPQTTQQAFEAHALQKLGGSIAFIKKTNSFVWTGEKKDDARPTSR
jgi:hypothetical protein